MVDLKTNYMGLTLDNPIIVGSSGLTQSLERVKKCASAGAGAVVLKSIFEEQIEREIGGLAEASSPALGHSEALDYLQAYGRENSVDDYLDLVRDAKKELEIPIIPSIHCMAGGSWTEFAARAEKAGADALELNLFILPGDPEREGAEIEKVYLDIAKQVRKQVKIPISMKVGPHFSGVANHFARLGRAGVNGLVLFNRFYRLDFDIENFRIIPAGSFSSADEHVVPLRWISMLSGRIDCDLAATTGVHDGEAVVKMLLAGASAVQVCSALYKDDLTLVSKMLTFLRNWMEHHGMTSVAQFQGRMAQEESEDPSAYERVQFMRFSLNAP